ncbi:hypothetical protein BGZ76_011080 [Entomortierella beljakovae]|nr:hypothetical protein BGZ76_011080 [Entomortierella beljakovae]
MVLDFEFSDDLLKLNFIGVVSLFGGEIALSALRYTVLISNVPLSLYLSMIVSPGMQTVALKMFRRMEDKVSKAISGGESDDNKDIIGLSASGAYNYLGLHSGTKMNIGSILGDALVTETEVKFTPVECTRTKKQNRDLKLKVLQLAVTFTVRGNGIKYPMGSASGSSPPGDAIVENLGGTDPCLILADENTLQYLLQKPLIVPPHPTERFWVVLHLFAAYLSYIIVIVNIIAIPYFSIAGQLIFGILMLLGAIQNILLSISNGRQLLLRSIRTLINIESQEGYIFQTRASMIAYCMLRSKSTDVKQLKHLLPNTATFEVWFGKVTNCVRSIGDGGEPAFDTVNEGLMKDLDPVNEGLMKDLDADLRDAHNVLNPGEKKKDILVDM